MVYKERVADIMHNVWGQFDKRLVLRLAGFNGYLVSSCVDVMANDNITEWWWLNEYWKQKYVQENWTPLRILMGN